MPIAFPRRAGLRPREDEVDVRDAQRAEVLAPGRAERSVELAESPILEDEPPREPAAQLRRRLECSNAALLRPRRGRARVTASMTFAGSATSGGRIMSSLGP